MPKAKSAAERGREREHGGEKRTRKVVQREAEAAKKGRRCYRHMWNGMQWNQREMVRMGASSVSKKGGVEGEEEKAGEGEQVEERRNIPADSWSFTAVHLQLRGGIVII